MPSSSVVRLVEHYVSAIEQGDLSPGALLPTHRALAARHRVAVATASKVYARLKSLGFVIGETGRGTFVRDRPRLGEWDRHDEARASHHSIDLSFTHPPVPQQAALLRKMLCELASSGDLAALMHQQPTGGRTHERQIVADFLARARRIQTDAEHILLTSGTQAGLDAVARALRDSRRAVAVDALTYPGFKMVAESYGLALSPVPVRQGGTDLAALDAICRRNRIAAIYTMPTVHNPLGWVLDTAHREGLVSIARRYDCLLIEDAAHAYLAGVGKRVPPPLVALAPERTVYLSSLSKSLASGLRFGYLIAPSAWRRALKSALRASHWSLSSVVSAMATRWLDHGTVERIEASIRRDAARRQSLAREILAGMDVVAHRNSLFLWLALPEGVRMDRAAAALGERGIAVSKGEAYATTRHAPHALRLSIGSPTLAQLDTALRRVRDTIEGLPI
ncbi:aminotransferase-like domain-containing protein [Chitinasiproducens palmae]|uniref:DNA-binding transcriptional regulator, MocR family, contains an aminotransferase domain n=1 Tax=Chitinasiproducens palmae TaxID=1770053 RepID=A0A1H2PUC7_9BURK|nr:PLP-dependent aminotransferase family protein [Chitinasiproducens palmae]SDV50775.1 DNA-binding transcriptional regulator, MocR family, contains an aminotransferase domain [Chitinasiproducens palmae]